MSMWQIACGESGRYYDDIFIKYDVMFMGPGRYGCFSEEEYRKQQKAGNLSTSSLSQLNNFTNFVRPGDKILLRKGYNVIAIGMVDNDLGYSFDEAFDDIYGWDLQHTRHVIWQEHLMESLRMMQPDKGLFADRKQIPTFTQVKDEKIKGPIMPLLERCVNRPLRDFPKVPPKPLEFDELGRELFSKGLSNESVDRVITAIQRQRRMAKWYADQWAKTGRPTEHEVVAHMILPLMLALGWSEQLLAVEWQKIDLAAFYETPTTAEKCILVFEAKGLGQGLQDAREQAINYTIKHHLSNCNKIALTDGFRIYLYESHENKWRESPSGYINLGMIRTNHIAPPNTNAIDTLVALTPAGVTYSVEKRKI